MGDGDGQPDRLTEERVARNDARFRRANEQIEEAAYELDQDGLLPFLCECADLACTQVVELSLGEYEAVRADSRHFLNAPGHEVAGRGTGAVVQRNDRFVVYEKRGHAGEVAERLDARGALEDPRAAAE